MNPTEAEWLLESASGIARTELARSNPNVDEDAADRFHGLVQRRSAGEPLQYIVGVAGFRYLDVAVGPGVFIPRPETELVAERAMQRLPDAGTVVDVGTGSGAIALAIAQERPDATVLATELSLDALEWARKNRDAFGLPVELLHGDLLDPLPQELTGRLDVVVANMPYIPKEEEDFLPVDVRAHEPELALFGAGGGLAAIERLAEAALGRLRPGGWLVLEIGEGQGTRVTTLLASLGYAAPAVYDDLTGRQRMVDAHLPR